MAMAKTGLETDRNKVSYVWDRSTGDVVDIRTGRTCVWVWILAHQSFLFAFHHESLLWFSFHCICILSKPKALIVSSQSTTHLDPRDQIARWQASRPHKRQLSKQHTSPLQQITRQNARPRLRRRALGEDLPSSSRPLPHRHDRNSRHDSQLRLANRFLQRRTTQRNHRHTRDRAYLHVFLLTTLDIRLTLHHRPA